MSGDMIKAGKAVLERMLTTLKKKVEPSHTALIVVDVQNDFCAKGGVLASEGYDLRLVESMVPKLISFIDQARKEGITIIYIQSIYNTEDNRYLSDSWIEQTTRRTKGRIQRICEPGCWGADFYEGIKPLPGEIIVNKHRYSAFINTDLDLILRSRGIRTLIMTGVATNVCVESTVRDGFMKDYYIVFLKDCTATYSEEFHNHTLKIVDLYFGQVVDSTEVLRCWSHQQPPPPAL